MSPLMTLTAGEELRIRLGARHEGRAKSAMYELATRTSWHNPAFMLAAEQAPASSKPLGELRNLGTERLKRSGCSG